jgi:cell division septum initiation protein DivIVA
MATPRVCAGLILAALSMLYWQASVAFGADPEPLSISIRLNSPDQRHEDEIRRVLAEPTQIEIVDMPLRDVMRHLSDLHKIQILSDVKALEDVGASSDTQITFHVKNISLESALDLMLKDHDLTWIIQNGVLQITSNDRASEQLATRLYPVKDLVQKNAEGIADYKPLAAMIQKSIAMTAWDEVGGSSTIEPYAGLLVISTTEQVHRQIEGLLRAMRVAEARTSANPAAEAEARHESSDDTSSIQFVRWANDEVEVEASGSAEPEAPEPAASEHRTSEARTLGQVPKMVEETENRVLQELNNPTTVEFVDTELATHSITLFSP